MDEFGLIREYFAARPARRSDVVLGIGDDAALLRSRRGCELVVAADVLVGGVHFPDATEPRAVGHKALAVNLSDLAAMGAEPAWATLCLTLPVANPGWLGEFSAGLLDLADIHSVTLVGGDTARGPLSIAVQIMGWVPSGLALRRDGARPGDRIFVSGTLGDAALALMEIDAGVGLAPGDAGPARRRLDYPEPRVELGLRLRGLATSAIDLSDGLAADLGHVTRASGVGARVELERLPRSDVLRRRFDEVGWGPAAAGGDDYELCFTAPPHRGPELAALAAELGLALTEVGEITDARGLDLVDRAGAPWSPGSGGYRHF